MRRLFGLALALPLVLAACGGCKTLNELPSSPQNAANATVLDEQALTGVELSYKAARIAVEIAVDAHQCVGACATRFRTLNTQAHNAVLAARTAYNASNSAGYLEAIRNAHLFINQVLALTGRANEAN